MTGKYDYVHVQMYIGVLFYGTVVVKLIMLDDRTIYFVTEIIEIGNFIKFKMEKKKLFSLLSKLSGGGNLSHLDLNQWKYNVAI